MKRSVLFLPAYDKRHPKPSKNYGIHGVHVWFSVVDPETHEGLTFSIATNWHLPHVQAEQDERAYDPQVLRLFYKPQAFSVDIHRTQPMYEGQTPRETCEITGGLCYCDGSGLLGQSFLETLITSGDEALFDRMEEQFKQWTKIEKAPNA